MNGYYPSYRNLLKNNLFEERIERAGRLYSPCLLCPRKCKAKRKEGQKGVCRVSDKLFIASYNLHFGEEPPISGYKGSGTIFFSYCNLRCVYCQNYPISQLAVGREVSIEDLSNIMILLEKRGAHNINLVTPTHYVYHILKAIYLASKKGLSIPIVYNTSGYESLDALFLLDGIVDIYLTDIRYFNNKFSLKYSGVPDYKERVVQAVKEMYRQVGNLLLDERGIGLHGLIIRHLVLPNNISSTEQVLKFIKENISPYTYISLMNQYFPAHRAKEFPEINRKITKEEFDKAVKFLYVLGLENGWIQEWEE